MRRPLLRAALALVAAVALGGGAAAVASAQSSSSGPQISRSTDAVAGRTVIAWSAPFARYLAQSRASDCARGQRGLVFFIPGTSRRNDRTDCTAAAGQPIMVSPVTVICTPPDRGFCTDTARVNDVRRVRLSIDGTMVRKRNFDWVSRQGFRIGGEQASVAGYMYIVEGLAPGPQTIVSTVRVRTPTGPSTRG